MHSTQKNILKTLALVKEISYNIYYREDKDLDQLIALKSTNDFSAIGVREEYKGNGLCVVYNPRDLFTDPVDLEVFLTAQYINRQVARYRAERNNKGLPTFLCIQALKLERFAELLATEVELDKDLVKATSKDLEPFLEQLEEKQ